MAGSNRNTMGDRPIVLTFPSPIGPLVARGGADARGCEHLHGQLTDELREALASGGCGLRAWTAAVLEVVAACGGSAAVELAGDARRLQLIATPAGGGAPVTRALVVADFYFSFTWGGAARVLPMAFPAEGSPDFVGALPQLAQALLEQAGQAREEVNARLRAQLAQRQDAGLPLEVRLDLPDPDDILRARRREYAKVPLAERRPRYVPAARG